MPAIAYMLATSGAARLVDVRRAAARRAVPCGLGPAARARVADEGRAANRDHVLRRRRVADAADQDRAVAVAVVAGGEQHRDAQVAVVRLEQPLGGELAPAVVAVRDRVDD